MPERKDKYIVDRIEDGGIVVCEYNGEIFNFDISLFPDNVSVGNIYVFEDSSFVSDDAAKNSIKKRVIEKSKNLFK